MLCVTMFTFCQVLEQAQRCFMTRPCKRLALVLWRRIQMICQPHASLLSWMDVIFCRSTMARFTAKRRTWGENCRKHMIKFWKIMMCCWCRPFLRRRQLSHRQIHRLKVNEDIPVSVLIQKFSWRRWKISDKNHISGPVITQCNAMKCCAMQWNAMPRYVMLCYVMVWYAVLCSAMQCYAIQCYAMQCKQCYVMQAMLCNAILCNGILCYAVLCYAIQAMLCNAMLCCAVQCYAIQCNAY